MDAYKPEASKLAGASREPWEDELGVVYLDELNAREKPAEAVPARLPAHYRHGEPRSYRHGGCKCPECLAGWVKYTKRTKYNREHGATNYVPMIAARRKLQALTCLGYSVPFLAAELKRSPTTIREVLGTHWRTKETILRSTDKKIDALYERLSMKPLPPGQVATRIRNAALRRGWAPPLAWDDSTISDPDAKPDLGAAEKTDWQQELEFLLSCGVSEEQALKQLGRQPATPLTKRKVA